MAGRGVAEEVGQEERVHAVGTARLQRLLRLQDRLEAARGRADHGAHAIGVPGPDHEAGIAQGVPRSDHRHLHVAVHVPRLLGVEVPGDVEILDLAGDLHGIG